MIITTKRGAKYKGITVAADAGSYGYNRKLARAGFAGDWGSGHIQVTEREGDDYYWQSGYKTSYIDGNMRMFLSRHLDLTLGFEKSDRHQGQAWLGQGCHSGRISTRPGVSVRDFTRKYDVELQKLNMTYSNRL